MEEQKRRPLQEYFDDPYLFRDLILDEFVRSEQRRQSKNCSTVESWDVIAKEIEEDINRDQYPLMEVLTAFFVALGRAGKGETVEK